MVDRIVVGVVGIVLLAGVAGIAVAVPVQSYTHHVTQTDHAVTTDKAISIDSRTTVYAGSDTDGVDVTVRNDGGTDFTVNVTVTLVTVDGTVVASESAQKLVLTGMTESFQIRFAANYAQYEYDIVEVEAVVT